MDSALFTSNTIQLFLLVFVRIAGMIFLLPVFGATNVPITIKIGLSAVLTVLCFPLMALKGPVALPPHIIMFVIMVLKEIAIGLIIGFAASLLFTVIQFAGHLADSQMGFTFVELVDPFTDMPVTTLGQFQILIFTILFLLLNGHYFLLLAIQKSFEVIPLGGASHLFAGRTLEQLIVMTGDIFVLAMRLAAPVFSILLVTTVALGIVSRTVPQLNIFFMGMPISIIVGLGMTILTLPMLAHLFKTMVESMTTDIVKLFYLMA